MFKNILKHLGYMFVSSFFVFIAIVTSAILLDRLRTDTDKYSFRLIHNGPKWEVTDDLSGIEFEVQRYYFGSEDELHISGILINNTNNEWKDISIATELMMGDMTLNICKEGYLSVKSNDTVPFIISCNDVFGKTIDAELKFKTKVISGIKRQ